MMAGFPRYSCSLPATTHAATSIAPLGGLGTTMRTGWTGRSGPTLHR
jgi:hypothetical protein